MATAEIRGSSSEQQQAYRQLAGFLGRAEREFPAAARQLVNVVGGLVGEQRTTERKLQEGMGNIEVGLALIGDWLKETGAEGFDVKLGLGGGAKKAIGRSQVKFPTVSDLIRVGGRVDSGLQKQISPLLSSFSRQIKAGLDVGLTPRQIVGGLVAESVGSRLAANGSANLREALNKPLGGHFEWIREVLGIADVAGQSGFKPMVSMDAKPAAVPKSLPEVHRAEIEFIRKKDRIRQYLTQENGMDFLGRSWDNEKWKHVGVDGYSKRVYKPLKDVLAESGVCLRRSVSGDVPSQAYIAADYFREETAFLKRVQGPNFVRVYAHAPLNAKSGEGVGEFKQSDHWELADFVDGVLVNRIFDRERGTVWPERLTPATRLSVLLAACYCENEAVRLSPPFYLTDLKTDAFILQTNGIVRMVDVQSQSEYAEESGNVIAKELSRLCIELFPGGKEYGTSDIERAVRGYLDPDWDKEDRKWKSSSNQPPGLLEIIYNSELPGGVGPELMDFLKDVRSGKLKFDGVPMDLARRILPIMQRLERQETTAKGEEIARVARAEAMRRVEQQMAPIVPEKKPWRERALEMAGNNFAAIGFRQTGNEIVGAAAFEFRSEIIDRTMTGETFKAMMKEINGIAKSYETRLGRPAEQKLPWPEVVEDMGRNNIAKTGFETTGSRIVAAAAYRFRQGILKSQDEGAQFKAMMREINKAVRKHRIGT